MTSAAAHAAWREAGTLIRRHRRPLMTALLLVLMNRLAALALPTASRYVVDEVIGRARADLLPTVALIACIVVAIEAATAFGAAEVAGLAGQHAISDLRRELQARLFGLPLSRIDEAQSGSLASQVMADTEQLRFLVGNGSVQLVASILTAALSLTLLAWVDPTLTFTVLSILALLAFDLRRAFHDVWTAFERVCRRQAELTGWLAQMLSGLRVVKAFVAERREAHRFVRESNAILRESMHAVRGAAHLGASSSLASGAIGVLLLVAGARAVAAGSMSLGSLVMFFWLTGLLLAPVVHIAASAAELGKAIAALTRVSRLRELATEEEEDRVRRRVTRGAGTVDLVDVSYRYTPGRVALRGVSLHAAAGSVTALVGPSGSGKSTLCRLLLAFDYPSRGRILIDGWDLTTVRRRDHRAHVGVVLQDDVLFDGTIVDNIRYGRPGASRAEVLAAARSAHCDEFVDSLPHGYGTLVGACGMRLSCGQRQRVEIARALLADPRFLVLDEVTSHLDNESELLIQAALRTLCRGRTTFLVAHRLSTIQAADQILVMDNGMIAEQGTHEDLVAREGRYWRLHQTAQVAMSHSPVAAER